MDIAIPQWIVDFVIWFAHLFAPAQWQAMVLLVVVTLGATHALKIAWRVAPFTRGGGSALINFFAVLIGFFATLFLWPAGGPPWWLIGWIPGPLASLCFKLFFALLKAYAPRVAAGFNAERRQVCGLPPAGLPDRRKA